MKIGKYIYAAIQDGEYGLFLGCVPEPLGKIKYSAWIKNKTHGISNTHNYAFGGSHQEALNNLDKALKNS